jgi:predicted RecA/RadA family phage recombinase
MPQVPANIWAQGDLIDYTPAGAVTAGDVIVLGGVVYVAPCDIAASTLGVLNARSALKLPKKTGAIAAGDPVYWDATGSPNTGTASSGAAFNTPCGPLAGQAISAAVSGDDFVYVERAGTRPPSPSRTQINADVAAAGSVQGDAAAILEGFTVVTGADGTKGVILPTPVAGMRVEIKSTTAAVLKIYPTTGAAINAIAANGAYSAASLVPLTLIAKTTTQWYTLPLLGS